MSNPQMLMHHLEPHHLEPHHLEPHHLEPSPSRAPPRKFAPLLSLGLPLRPLRDAGVPRATKRQSTPRLRYFVITLRSAHAPAKS